jgi:ABC-type multidrug transport system fused ATPase/permease subunit
MLQNVMGSTIRFFDTTPAGRIINRFSRDIETIDGSLTSSLRTVLQQVATLIGSLALVASIVPAFLLPAAFISYGYYRLSVVYLSCTRDLRRIEATKRSPIFGGFAELLDGITVVRAYGVEGQFRSTLFKQVDGAQGAFYHMWMANRWLLVRMDSLGAASVFFTSILALAGAVPAGLAGVAILSAQTFVEGCYWISRFWGGLEQDFNSVERAKTYLELPQEPPSTIEGHRPPAYWPSSTTTNSFLSCEKVSIKYAPDLPNVINKVSFEIKAREKIGLLGRTGSGKSTMAMGGFI